MFTILKVRDCNDKTKTNNSNFYATNNLFLIYTALNHVVPLYARGFVLDRFLEGSIIYESAHRFRRSVLTSPPFSFYLICNVFLGKQMRNKRL